MAKYIIVAGGVISGTGKGVSAASLALLLKLRGFTVELIKFDPYLNVNAGILAPREHGECFLCDDGTECDLDLGHYERIAGVTVSNQNICTSGTLYKELILEQERGDYLGQTVQIMPHMTGKVQKKLLDLGSKADIVIAEIGGTVGDIESAGFYEAIREFKQKADDDVIVAMVAPVLWIETIKEFKTKPLQNSIRELQRHGLHPDLLLCRVDRKIPDGILDKVANITSIPRACIFDAPDVKTIYQVPLEFWSRHIDDTVVDILHLKRTACRIYKHRDLVDKYIANEMSPIEIGVFGKYANCEEAYISLKEALIHAGISNDVKVKIRWVNAEELETYKDMRGIHKFFEGLHGIIIPGGFDARGVEGKIKAIRYVREKKIPFLGICLGLQCSVIEFARNVCGINNANSMEFDKECMEPVVHYVHGQQNIDKKSGTMRLGAYDCALAKNSLAYETYGKSKISERHRHRLEVNSRYVDLYARNGFVVSGINPETNLIEVMELDRQIHPYFIGIQAHPEFKSRLVEPAPLFNGLVRAAKAFKETEEKIVTKVD